MKYIVLLAISTAIFAEDNTLPQWDDDPITAAGRALNQHINDGTPIPWLIMSDAGSQRWAKHVADSILKNRPELELQWVQIDNSEDRLKSYQTYKSIIQAYLRGKYGEEWMNPNHPQSEKLPNKTVE